MAAFLDLYAPDFFATLIANLNPAESSCKLPPDVQIGPYTLIGFARPSGPWYLRRDDIILKIKLKIKKDKHWALRDEIYTLTVLDEKRRVRGGSLESSILAEKIFFADNPRMEALVARIKDCVAFVDYIKCNNFKEAEKILRAVLISGRY